jgi:hypothetical protein
MVRQAAFLIAAVLVFGIAVPYSKGFDFLDPIFILGYACLGVLFVTPAAAEVFSDTLPPAGLLLKMLAIWGYGWGISVILTSTGILTVNFRQRHAGMVMPSVRLLLAALFLGATASLATIAGAALLAKRWNPKIAKTILRLGFLMLLLLLAVAFRFLPEQWRSTIEDNLTTAGLTSFAFRLGALLALGGAAMTALVVQRRQPR